MGSSHIAGGNACRGSMFLRSVVVATFVLGQFCGRILESFFPPQSLGASSSYLLLCNKLLQNLGASKNNHTTISHNSMSQKNLNRAQREYFIIAPCGACRAEPSKMASSLTV